MGDCGNWRHYLPNAFVRSYPLISLCIDSNTQKKWLYQCIGGENWKPQNIRNDVHWNCDNKHIILWLTTSMQVKVLAENKRWEPLTPANFEFTFPRFKDSNCGAVVLACWPLVALVSHPQVHGAKTGSRWEPLKNTNSDSATRNWYVLPVDIIMYVCRYLHGNSTWCTIADEPWCR